MPTTLPPSPDAAAPAFLAFLEKEDEVAMESTLLGGLDIAEREEREFP